MYEKINALLEESHKTAYQLAKDTGISQAAISNWRKGATQPNLENICKIAMYFDKPIEYFVGK